MSRLQVGGLALVIDSKHKDNIGRVVKLVSFLGKRESPWDMGCSYDYWETKYDHRKGTFNTPSHLLLPLGDKQTQDQFKKEECEA